MNKRGKQRKKFFLSILFIVLLTACGKDTDSKIETTSTSLEVTKETYIQEQKVSIQDRDAIYPITLTDQIGREVVLEKPVKRIVSSYYISSAILIALGKEENLVGIEMKAETRELYKMAAGRLLELPAVGSLKGIHIEETAALNPDLVVIPKKLKDVAEQFETLGIPVFVVDPETIENYNACVRLLGEAVEAKERAEELLSYYQEKQEEVEALLKDVTEYPTVYLSSGSSFLSTCTLAMYQNDLIEMAGGKNVSSELGEDIFLNGTWAEVSKEQVLAWNPDYILPVSYAQYSIEEIKNDPDLAEITAIKENQVYLFPSAIEPWDYPTPSSALGILWLTHILHPDLYTKEQYVKEAKEFYQRFFEIEVEEKMLGVE